jgi:hypothetical protein
MDSSTKGTTMVWDSLRACVVPGHAVVAREGAAIVVADPQTGQHEKFVDDILGLCGSEGSSGEAADVALIRRVAGLALAGLAADVPSFGIAVNTTGGTAVLLSGSARLSATFRDGRVDELVGSEALTLVDRLLGDDLVALVLTVTDTDAEPDARSNLAAGVVRGAGVRLAGAPVTDSVTAPSAPQPPEAGPQPAPDTESQDVVEPEPAPPTDTVDAGEALAPDDTVDAGEALAPDDTVDAGEALAPNDDDSMTAIEEPTETGNGLADVDDTAGFESIDLFADEPEVSGGETSGAGEGAGDVTITGTETGGVNDSQHDGGGAVHQPVVQGIVCSRGHFNRPEGRFCAQCGISMVHQTHNLVTGPRPPLGVLVVDDGTVFALRGDYVIGRAPEESEDVATGAANALLLDDPELTISRVHARVVLDGWEVRVSDAGSANGSYVRVPPSEDWTRLEAHLPTTIEPGTLLSFGGRVVTFESHQRD